MAKLLLVLQVTALTLTARLARPLAWPGRVLFTFLLNWKGLMQSTLNSTNRKFLVKQFCQSFDQLFRSSKDLGFGTQSTSVNCGVSEWWSEVRNHQRLFAGLSCLQWLVICPPRAPEGFDETPEASHYAQSLVKALGTRRERRKNLAVLQSGLLLMFLDLSEFKEPKQKAKKSWVQGLN